MKVVFDLLEELVALYQMGPTTLSESTEPVHSKQKGAQTTAWAGALYWLEPIKGCPD
jgi:hypothetical protein